MNRFPSVPALFCTALLSSCAFARPPATDYDRIATYSITPMEDTALKRAIEGKVKTHEGLSGFRLIARGQDALLIRLALIEAAERSVDIQYYSMQNDKSGKLLMDAILRAADRGVRVRILIDDITISKSDRTWAKLDSHPHISLRLFNPLATKDQGFFGPVTNIFTRAHQVGRRMHNKAFIVDNQIAIMGGRNLGDAYFDSSPEFNFRDIDILAAGPISQKISDSFDSFWNGKEAYPIKSLNAARCGDGVMDSMMQSLRDECKEVSDTSEFPLPPAIVKELSDDNPPLVWAKAELEADSPTKVEKPRDEVQSKPMSKLAELANHAQHEVIIVSPYFVPGDDGVEWLKAMVDRGVKVRVLTNSLASTDVVAVHTGYRRYREALLKAGVELYEMKAIRGGKKVRTGRFSSSSRASLHTKVYVVDRKDILIGTMNLDPRSVQLNTEMALVIHNNELSENVAQMFEKAARPASSYHIQFAPGTTDKLEWATEEKDGAVRYKGDPDAGMWRRIKESIYSLLPIENQL